MAEQLEPHILKKYQILQKLGKGAYGVVWKAIDKDTRETVALKKVFDAFQNATDAQRTFRQVMFLKELKGHPNIVKLEHLIKSANNRDLYLVFDFMETDLHAVIRANILQDVHKKYVMYQVLKGLKYMHSGDLIHRDLKPSNILLDSDCLAKLADFGLARSVASINQGQGQAIMTQYVATRWYRAPQILMGSSKYTKSVDMWSIGCIMAEMYTGKSIFPGTSTLNQIQKIIELLGRPNNSDIQALDSVMARECINQIHIGKKKSFTGTFNNIDEFGLDLLRKLLVFNPSNRCTVQQALSHPYLQDFHDISQQIQYKGVIRIPVDENTKFSIKDYRQFLYREMTKKMPQKKTISPDQATHYVNKKYKTETVEQQDQANKGYTVASKKGNNHYIQQSDSWKDKKRQSIKTKVQDKQNLQTKSYLAHSKQKNNWVKQPEKTNPEKRTVYGERQNQRTIYSYGYNRRR